MAGRPSGGAPRDLPRLPPRRQVAHKGDFGKVLAVAGSVGMTGAAVLCARAAMRAGAGWVTVATPRAAQAVVAAGCVEGVTEPLPDGGGGTLASLAEGRVEALAASHTVAAIGPGLGRTAEVEMAVRAWARALPIPVVLDADALYALRGGLGDLLAEAAGPRILTPHEGEMARLAGVAREDIAARRADVARDYAAQNRCVVVLKGSGTVVSDGASCWTNPTGNPGMATAGSGDVLCGIVAAFLAQGLAPYDAARSAAWVHGRAGDLAASEVGEVSLIASDLLTHLPAALRAWLGR